MSRYTKKVVNGVEYGTVSEDNKTLVAQGVAASQIEASEIIGFSPSKRIAPPKNVKRDENGIFPV